MIALHIIDRNVVDHAKRIALFLKLGVIQFDAIGLQVIGNRSLFVELVSPSKRARDMPVMAYPFLTIMCSSRPDDSGAILKVTDTLTRFRDRQLPHFVRHTTIEQTKFNGIVREEGEF